MARIARSIDISSERDSAPNLRRMRDAFGLMDEGKKQGGLAGWIKAKRGAVIAAATFVSLYTIPVIRSEPPKNVRLEPAY